MIDKIDKFLDKNAMKVVTIFWIYLFIIAIIGGIIKW